jgi:hypothetical protein
MKQTEKKGHKWELNTLPHDSYTVAHTHTPLDHTSLHDRESQNKYLTKFSMMGPKKNIN